MSDYIQALYKKSKVSKAEELIMRVTNYAWDELTQNERQELREQAAAELAAMQAALAKARTKAIEARDSAFYSGIMTALNLLDLHGEDTIYDELVALCYVQELVAVAKAEEELEWSGLVKHGYAQAAK